MVFGQHERRHRTQGLAKSVSPGTATITTSYTSGSISFKASTDLTVVSRASASSESSDEDNSPSVLFYLPQVSSEAPAPIPIFVDGHQYGELAGGTWITVNLAFGAHEVTGSDRRNVVQILVGKQRSYYFKLQSTDANDHEFSPTLSDRSAFERESLVKALP